MAQNYYSLEEAAEKLKISVPDFKRRLRTEWTHIRPLQDGSTQRFRQNDVEELARQIGFGSEEELQLVDSSSDEMTIPIDLVLADEDAPPSTKAPSSKKKISPAKAKHDDEDGGVLRLTEAELNLGDQDVFLMTDSESPTPEKKSSSSKIKSTAKSDSDVRLGQSGKIKRPEVEEPSDEIELDILPRTGSSSRVSAPGKSPSASSGKLPSSKLPSGGKSGTQKDDDSSEFELNLDADSSDEFELSLAKDSSDEISLGDLPAPKQGDSKAGLASGINISRPRDAGLSLEKKAGASSKKIPSVKLDTGRSSKKLPPVKLDDSDDEIDFELSLDHPGASSKKLSSSKKLPDSDSEFDLQLDDSVELAAEQEVADLNRKSGKEAKVFDDKKTNDIFETDFEIPALDDDSASEVVAIDDADTDLESSDFDLAIDESGDIEVDDESGSEVVVIDDEVEEPVRKKKKPTKATKSTKRRGVVEDEDAEGAEVSFDDMDLDEGISASKALKGLRQGEVVEPVERVVVVGNAPWGALPAIVMFPTMFIIFIAGLMAYEMMHSMWGYHQPTAPSNLVFDNVAEMFDMKPKEQ